MREECQIEHKKIRDHQLSWPVICKYCADDFDKSDLDKSFEAYWNEECVRLRAERDKALAEVKRLTAMIKGPNWTDILNL